MKISLNWLNDYVDLSGIDSEEIVRRLTLSTAEVEGIEKVGENVKGVVFAKILKVENHPESQKLHILQVDKGDEVVQVVCAAPNVREGMITAFATMGGVVCGKKISKAKLAGVESYGMCCSEFDLGIGSDDAGIIDVKENVKIGVDIKTVWPIDDEIIEIDNKSLTNRPDLWGHYGIARELSAIFERPLKELKLFDEKLMENLPKRDVKVETDKCFRYTCASVENVTQKTSPIALKIRLINAGMRDINLLADLTNYVMLDLGEPMHAFDNEVVKGINVLSAKEGDKITTLEGEERTIPKDAIVIADQNRTPVAIAGIKGGLLSGISDKTNSLLLEAATFDAITIRKASLSLGLRTDSSLRYEKTLDPEITKTAILRYMYLLTDIDKNVRPTSSISDVYVYKYPVRKIEIAHDFISRRIGLDVSTERIVKILNSLGFKVEVLADKLVVTVPSYRGTKDVSINEDLVEEVARMIGYDNIQPKNIESPVLVVRQNKEHVCEFETKRLLAEKFDANEVHTYIWNYVDFNNEHKIEAKSFVNLLDASNAGQSGIRSVLIPSLLKVVDENRLVREELKVFEIARVVAGVDENELVKEEKHLSIVISTQTRSEREIYFELKNMLDSICRNIVNVEYKLCIGSKEANYHPFNSCDIFVNGEKIGQFGLLHPSVVLAKKQKVGALELDFAKLCAMEEKVLKVKKPSKYQCSKLDFNFVVDKDVSCGQVEDYFKEFKCKFDVEFTLKDIYINENELPNKKSMTFSFIIASQDHTMSGKEIENFSYRLLEHMKSKGIELRK